MQSGHTLVDFDGCWLEAWLSDIPKNLPQTMNQSSSPTTVSKNKRKVLKTCRNDSKKPKQKRQDVFVKHECPRNGHFLRNVTIIFDLDLCR